MSKKKAKITEETRVNVYNNVDNKIVFTDSTHNKVTLRRAGQYKVLYVRDLRHIMSEAEALLTEGILFIKNQDVRKFLEIDELYKDGTIIEYGEIDKILESKPEEVEKKVKKASKTMKKEIGQKATKKVDELTVGTAKTIEKETGVSLENDKK